MRLFLLSLCSRATKRSITTLIRSTVADWKEKKKKIRRENNKILSNWNTVTTDTTIVRLKTRPFKQFHILSPISYITYLPYFSYLTEHHNKRIQRRSEVLRRLLLFLFWFVNKKKKKGEQWCIKILFSFQSFLYYL